MSDNTDGYEPAQMTRRQALKGGSAAAVAAGSYLLQQQLVGVASAQTTEPRINLGDDYAIDDNPDGNGDLVITDLSSSTEVLRWDRSESEWVLGSARATRSFTSDIVGASVGLSTDQTFPDSTSVKVAFDSVQYNHDNQFDTANHQFTVSETGVYHISTQVQFANMNEGDLMVSAIFVNGSRIAANNYIMGQSGKQSVPIERTVELSVGDVVTIEGFQQSGSDKDVPGVPDVTFAGFVKIG